jgi:hypothetical protein
MERVMRAWADGRALTGRDRELLVELCRWAWSMLDEALVLEDDDSEVVRRASRIFRWRLRRFGLSPADLVEIGPEVQEGDLWPSYGPGARRAYDPSTEAEN